MTPLEIAIQTQNIVAFYVVQPVIILLLGIFVGKIAEQIIIFFGREFAPKRTRVRVAAIMTGWVIYIAAGCWAFASIGILAFVLEIVSAVVLFVVLAHFLLSLRDFISNFRHFRAIQKKVPRNATLTTKFGTGTVVSVSLADTHLKLKNGDDLFIPNKTMHELKLEIEKAKA